MKTIALLFNILRIGIDMKLLKNGFENQVHKVIHSKCSSELEVEPCDVVRTFRDFNVSGCNYSDIDYVICPVCNKEFSIPAFRRSEEDRQKLTPPSPPCFFSRLFK